MFGVTNLVLGFEAVVSIVQYVQFYSKVTRYRDAQRQPADSVV